MTPMAGDISITVAIRRPDGSVTRYAFTVDEFTQVVDADDVQTITFADVTDWRAVG